MAITACFPSNLPLLSGQMNHIHSAMSSYASDHASQNLTLLSQHISVISTIDPEIFAGTKLPNMPVSLTEETPKQGGLAAGSGPEVL